MCALYNNWIVLNIFCEDIVLNWGTFSKVCEVKGKAIPLQA